MSNKKSPLAQIDTFVETVSDETTRTSLGGILTLLLPVVCAAYTSYMVVRTNNAPPTQSISTKFAFQSAFNLTVTCNAPKGCLMTLNYEGQSSQLCKSSIEDRYPGYFPSTWKDRCKELKFNEEFTFPVCYTADSLDGPHFLWEREQNCSMQADFGRGGDTNKPAIQPLADCRSGIAIKASFIDTRTGVVSGPLLLPLFYGTHVLTMEEITSKLFGESTHVLQNAPVLVSDQSFVSSTSMCCPKLPPASSCQAGVNVGQVNDHYVVAGLGLNFKPGSHYAASLRIFPQYNSVEIYRDELYSLIFSSLGSIYSVAVTVFAGILIFYRKFTTPQKVAHDEKATAAKSSYVPQSTGHV